MPLKAAGASIGRVSRILVDPVPVFICDHALLNHSTTVGSVGHLLLTRTHRTHTGWRKANATRLPATGAAVFGGQQIQDSAR